MPRPLHRRPAAVPSSLPPSTRASPTAMAYEPRCTPYWLACRPTLPVAFRAPGTDVQFEQIVFIVVDMVDTSQPVTTTRLSLEPLVKIRSAP
jgi:hypothetical protein